MSSVNKIPSVAKMLAFLKKRGFKDFSEVVPKNAFKLFGLQENFKINSGQLRRELHNLQREFHPDRFMNVPKASREKSYELSIFVNDYFQILENPYLRGQFLLGILTNKSMENINEQLENLQLEPEFLAKMMELRERIDDEPVGSLSRLDMMISADLDKMVDEIDKDFKSRNLDQILPKLARLKFLVNCHRAIRAKFDTFGTY